MITRTRLGAGVLALALLVSTPAVADHDRDAELLLARYDTVATLPSHECGPDLPTPYASIGEGRGAPFGHFTITIEACNDRAVNPPFGSRVEGTATYVAEDGSISVAFAGTYRVDDQFISRLVARAVETVDATGEFDGAEVRGLTLQRDDLTVMPPTQRGISIGIVTYGD